MAVIKGHALLHEGYAVRVIDPATDDYGGWSEGCECGERPVPRLSSIAAMKRWHREHKARLGAVGITHQRYVLAWLMWCYSEGYRTVEDRALMSNWMVEHQDNAEDEATRQTLLTMADEVLAWLRGDSDG